MTDTRKIKVKNRLGELMRQPGGRSLLEALQGAEKRLDKVSGEMLTALDQSIGQMEAAAARLGESPDDKAVTVIYQAANDIIAIAGLVGFKAIDVVAHGLCDLIDVFRAENQWSAQAIRVHVDAVLLLRAVAKGGKAEQDKVIRGLQMVWERFGVREPATPPPAAKAAAKA